MEDFIKTLFGEMPLGELSAYMVFGLIGATGYLLLKISNRKKSDNGKPEVWSWKFFIEDNIFRLLFTFLLVFLWARFAPDLTSWVPESLYALGAFTYVIIGAATDAIVALVAKKIGKIEIKV